MTAPFVISTKWDTCLEWITNWHYPELRGYFTLKSLLHGGLKQVMSLFTLGHPLCHLGQWLIIFYWPKKVFSDTDVDILRNKTERSILCKIRLSAHNLAIERGRHLGLLTSDRICILTWHATLALKTIEGSK